MDSRRAITGTRDPVTSVVALAPAGHRSSSAELSPCHLRLPRLGRGQTAESRHLGAQNGPDGDGLCTGSARGPDSGVVFLYTIVYPVTAVGGESVSSLSSHFTD